MIQVIKIKIKTELSEEEVLKIFKGLLRIKEFKLNELIVSGRNKCVS